MIRKPFIRVVVLLIALLLFMALIPMAPSAQTFGDGFTVFGGAKYSHAVTDSNGFVGALGGCIPIAGPVHTLIYTEIGKNSTAATEIAALFQLSPTSRFAFGAVAGPNVDWKGNEDWVAYLTGAAGGIVTIRLTGLILDIEKPWGAWVYGKYKATTQKDNLFKQGWVVGGGLYLRI